MKANEKELDRLVQMLCVNHRCHICGAHDAQAIHHIVGRANMALRYDFVNLLPVCHECHRQIHDKGLDVSKFIAPQRWQYLQQIKNKSYRDLLIFEYMQTEREFLQSAKQELIKVLSKQEDLSKWKNIR